MQDTKQIKKQLITFRMFKKHIDTLKKLARARSTTKIKQLEESLDDYFKKMTPEEKAEIIK